MDLSTILTVVSVLSAVALGWVGRARTIKQDTKDDASKDASLRTDMEYIKRGVDDVRVEQKLQGQRFDSLTERVTRVEESAKQAHYRLNRIDGQKD